MACPLSPATTSWLPTWSPGHPIQSRKNWASATNGCPGKSSRKWCAIPESPTTRHSPPTLSCCSPNAAATWSFLDGLREQRGEEVALGFHSGQDVRGGEVQVVR